MQDHSDFSDPGGRTPGFRDAIRVAPWESGSYPPTLISPPKLHCRRGRPRIAGGALSDAGSWRSAFRIIDTFQLPATSYWLLARWTVFGELGARQPV